MKVQNLLLLALLCSCSSTQRFSQLQHLQAATLQHQLHANSQQATLRHTYSRTYSHQDTLPLLTTETWTRSQQLQAHQLQQTDTLTLRSAQHLQTHTRTKSPLPALPWIFILALLTLILLLIALHKR